MRTAKEAFLKSAVRPAFERMAMTDAFQQAVEYAQLVFTENQPNETDPNAACAAHYRMEGAREALATLSTLHLQPLQPQPPKVQTLRPPK